MYSTIVNVINNSPKIWFLNNNIILKIKSYLRLNMDFLEELLIINNLYTLNKIADERVLVDEERIEFIKKYNKSNNRLFTPCKKYMIDDYKREVEKYESSNDA